MKISGEKEVKSFCIDYVEKVEIMFIFATVACVLVILSLVSINFVFHFLQGLEEIEIVYLQITK